MEGPAVRRASPTSGAQPRASTLHGAPGTYVNTCTSGPAETILVSHGGCAKLLRRFGPATPTLPATLYRGVRESRVITIADDSPPRE